MARPKKLAIEYRPTASLSPYANNSRQHSDEQVDQIAASIKEFGFTNPVLVDGANGVIAGHGRLLAAAKLKMKDVPVIELAHLSEAQKRAYVIADNRLGELATWDNALLQAELVALDAEGFNLELTGFSLDDFAAAPPMEFMSLASRFGVPPFSVLRAAEGWWQDRKRAWLAIGIQSELGRGENAL